MLDSNKYQAVIFDMDGVLIDSEPLWKIAMHDVFGGLGSQLSNEDFQRTVGLRIDQVVAHWNHEENWGVQNIHDVVDQIIDRMVILIQQNPQPLPGVMDTLKYLSESSFTIGLATSSPQRLIEAVLSGLNIKESFQAIHSAEHEPHGKPHPAVYLSAAETLNVLPSRCLVIEDSLNGVISAKAANMHVVCIPEKTHIPNPKLILADFNYPDLNAFLADFRSKM